MRNLKVIIFCLLFLGCEEYYLAETELQLKTAKKVITDLDFKITSIDTFWNLRGDAVLKYRINYRRGLKNNFDVDSLVKGYNK